MLPMSACSSPCRAACRAGLLLLLPLWVAVPAWGRDDADDARAAAELTAGLRKALTGEVLLGVLLDDRASKKVGDQLALVGFVDRKDQRALVEEKAAALLKDNDDLRKAFPKGVSTDGLKELPLRARIQREFAEGKHDDKTRAMLRQTRVKGVELRGGRGVKVFGSTVGGGKLTLVCQCVCLALPPGEKESDAEARVQRVVEALAKADDAVAGLNAEVRATVLAVLPPDRPRSVLQLRAADRQGAQGPASAGCQASR
jgi:hypothetical protein